MAKIIATAENFAFGPASKLVTVCEKLLQEGHEVTFIGEGTAYQLASKVNFTRIYRYNTDHESFFQWGEKIFREADALLSSVDRSSVILAKKVGIPVIWLDMLFWWWDEIPDYLFDIDLYIQQNSVKNERNMKKYKNKIKNMAIVGPIIDMSWNNKEKSNQLLVAFGGSNAEGWLKVGRDTNYPYTFTDLILNKVDTKKYDKVLFAGNEEIMKDLQKKYGNEKYTFTILSHSEWLREINRSKDILINPGLEAPLEAIAYGKPIFFLPPYNSSAYVELDEFRAKGLAEKGNSIHFSDYFSPKDLSGRDLRVIMKEFLDELKIFETTESILDDCAKRIDKYLNQPVREKNKQRKKQSEFLNSLGENGLTETVALINKLVSKF